MSLDLQTSVFLFELRIRANGTIFLHCTRGFHVALYNRIVARPGTHLRVGTFDFHETAKGKYTGTPDVVDANSAEEAAGVCSHILAIYRSMLLFEAVFKEPNSYPNWMVFHRRTPTGRDLSDLARAKGIYIPFLALPFKSTLVDVRPVASIPAKAAVVPKPLPKKDASPSRPASSEALAKLQALFSQRT